MGRWADGRMGGGGRDTYHSGPFLGRCLRATRFVESLRMSCACARACAGWAATSPLVGSLGGGAMRTAATAAKQGPLRRGRAGGKCRQGVVGLHEQ